jgi:hypothetical protein
VQLLKAQLGGYPTEQCSVKCTEAVPCKKTCANALQHIPCIYAAISKETADTAPLLPPPPEADQLINSLATLDSNKNRWRATADSTSKDPVTMTMIYTGTSCPNNCADQYNAAAASTIGYIGKVSCNPSLTPTCTLDLKNVRPSGMASPTRGASVNVCLVSSGGASVCAPLRVK